MFHSARLKLTAWYMFIIFGITTLFSAAFYHASTREISMMIHRLETVQESNEFRSLPPLLRGRTAPTIEELKNIKYRGLLTLIIVNGSIVIIAGGASYFLAGKTLAPIKVMMDEQAVFISNASHELRTPLTVLSAEMETALMEKKMTITQARALIKSNLEEVRELQQLSERLLQITRIGETPILDSAVISLEVCIAQANKKVHTLAQQKNIMIINNLEKDLSVKGDISTLTDALITIIENAIKYSHEGGTVHIDTYKKGKNAIISISDVGVGIAPSDVPHIFKRFYRADNSRSHIPGYGLGLSIAQEIIKHHAGYIHVQSTLGNGSRFTISLPLT